MNTNRLEAFSDGVLAIIITIMVLELKTPEETSWEALVPLLPVLISYLVSFIYIGSFWNNHHHLFQISKRVNSKILWANLHLLFWVSLIPFATSWIGENHLEPGPVAYYGFVLAMSGIAYFILQKSVANEHLEDQDIHFMVATNKKGLFSISLYILGALASYLNPWIGIIVYILVLSLWFIPNRQMEEVFKSN